MLSETWSLASNIVFQMSLTINEQNIIIMELIIKYEYKHV